VTGGRRLSQAISEGDGISIIALVADPETARAAEEQGRQSMRELRQTLTFLRDDEGVAAPVPTTRDISALVDNARAGGLAVELRVRGDLQLAAQSRDEAQVVIAEGEAAERPRSAGVQVSRDRVELLARQPVEDLFQLPPPV